MDIFSSQFLLALGSIIVLDIVLGGDNAVVIGMASRHLPTAVRKKAIYIGTAGAIIIRILMTLVAAYLLAIPYLQSLGGLILLPIAFKLLKPQENAADSPAATSFANAVKTIIIADAAMGIDNILAVAGAAHGNLPLVFIGLAISIPIIIWGSQRIASLMERFSWLVTGGAVILAYTAASMIVHDKIIGSLLQQYIPFSSYLLPILFISAVIVYQRKLSS